MAKGTATVPNSLIQAVILKKCDRAGRRPESSKACANGACQHTCEPAKVGACPHKRTVRYSVNSRWREKSFPAFTDAEAFQLSLSAGKKAQGALLVDPKAGNRPFLPECVKFIEGLARAKAAPKAKAPRHIVRGHQDLAPAATAGRGPGQKCPCRPASPRPPPFPAPNPRGKVHGQGPRSKGTLRAPAPKDGRPSPGQAARRRAGGRSTRTRHSGHCRTHPEERPPPFTASARPRPTRPTRPSQ